MDQIRHWLSFAVMMFSILFNTIDAAFILPPPEPKTEAQLAEMNAMFDEVPLAEEITVVRTSNVSLSQLHTLAVLQGLVARTEAAIFLDYGMESSRYAMKEFENAGHKLVYNDANGNPWNFASVVEKFKSHIADGGYILYSTTQDHGQLNTATNLATIYGWLPVTPELEETVISLGLTKKEDISEDEIDLEYLKEFYEEHKDSFRNDSLVHLYYYVTGMRDLQFSRISL